MAPHIDSLRGLARLGDFTADRRILLLAAMAVAVGCLGAGAAWVLSHLITVVSNLAYYGRLETAPLKGASDWIEDYRHLWEARLDRLGDYLLELQDKKKKSNDKQRHPPKKEHRHGRNDKN